MKLHCPKGHTVEGIPWGTRGAVCPEHEVPLLTGMQAKPRKPLPRVSKKREGQVGRQGSTLKRSQPERDWGDARRKVEIEGACRKCRDESIHLEAAHIIGRRHDKPRDGGKTLWVNPDRIVPLCPDCHGAYDAHDLDLLGYLSVEEQVQAVWDCGGIEQARRRIAPGAYREVFA